MRKRKHQFHCQKCGSPSEIYKKGKKHRVLVCPRCGVIATNPGLGALVGGGLGTLIPIPGVGTVLGAAAGDYVEEYLSRPKPQIGIPRSDMPQVTRHPNRSPSMAYVEEALRC